MSEEPQPLRLKPRPQTTDELPPAPEPPPPPPPPAPGAEQGDAAKGLRLKPRLNLAPEPAPPAEPPPPDPGFLEPPPPPPPPSPISFAPRAPAADEAPRFKLRPKINPASVPQPPEPAMAMPIGDLPPPHPPDILAPPPPPASMHGGGLPPPPTPRTASPLPPVSVLSAPPPPGSVIDPAPPGSIPKLSLSHPQDTKAPGPKGFQIRVADGTPKVGGKPVVKPGKTGAVLKKRPTLTPIAKAGIGVLVLAVTVGAFFSYRIFFPAPSPVVPIKAPPIAKPVHPADSSGDLMSKVATAPGRLINSGQNAIAAKRAAEQAKLDALTNGLEEPTPTPVKGAAELAQANLTKDVKVNNTPIVAVPSASAEFKAFVANASIGGVFQGKPAKALINGRITREGQLIDSELGVVFDHIDADSKVIYFKDVGGAVVSKSY